MIAYLLDKMFPGGGIIRLYYLFIRQRALIFKVGYKNFLHFVFS